MIRFDKINQIRLYSGPTSMKMGIYKIQQLIAFSFSPAEMLNSVFVFCSRNRKCVKVYYEDELGFWLLQNRITTGDFKWPEDEGGRLTVDRRQLEWLLKGLDVVERRPKPQIEAKYY